MADLEIHYSGDWAALYVDGQLDPDTVGDSYIAEERALELMGVTQVVDDAFMRGRTGREGVAETLDQVRAFKEHRDYLVEKAEQLEAQADELRSQAEEIRSRTCAAS